MNITLLSPKFNATVQSAPNHSGYPYQKKSTINHLKPLNADTVSFTGGIEKVTQKATKKVKSSGVNLLDVLEAQVAADAERLTSIARVYLDVLGAIAAKLKPKGFDINMSYCELNPVKSPKSWRNKVERSKSFKVPDTIRASIYCNDPYDLSKLNDLLLEMEERRFVVAPTDMSVKDLMKRGFVPTEEENMIMSFLRDPKNKNLKDSIVPDMLERGYDKNSVEKLLAEFSESGSIPSHEEFISRFSELKKEVPDLDIRLDFEGEGIDAATQIAKLPPKYRYSVGKPQKSGYEDIQIRFVRTYDKKTNPVQHELIILFGDNYASAKHDESTYVYSYLRDFSNLNVMKYFENSKYDNLTKRPKQFLSLIQQFFRTKVSEKLFMNGKNKDYVGIKDNLDVSFTKEDELKIKNYFNDFSDGVISIYDRFKVKANARYKRTLDEALKEDLGKISEIRKGLEGTIAHYKGVEPPKKRVKK